MTRPLTALSEDERFFKDMVAKFAREKIGPRVHDMDRDAKMDQAILDGCFELGKCERPKAAAHAREGAGGAPPASPRSLAASPAE